MALGASAWAHQEQVDVASVVALEAAPNIGVAAGAELARFARAAVTDHADLGGARLALESMVGRNGVADAAGMAGFFDGINRIADATGLEIPEQWAAAAGTVISTADLQRLSR